MHLVEAIGLVDVSVLGILDLLGRIPHKVVCLHRKWNLLMHLPQLTKCLRPRQDAAATVSMPCRSVCLCNFRVVLKSHWVHVHGDHKSLMSDLPLHGTQSSHLEHEP